MDTLSRLDQTDIAAVLTLCEDCPVPLGEGTFMGISSDHKVPIIWRGIMTVVAVGRTTVAGVGFGIAALGVIYVCDATHLLASINSIINAEPLDTFAVGGGVLGAIIGIIVKVTR